MRLTEINIRSARYRGKDNKSCVYWDSSNAGFGLRVYPTGRKAFVYKYRFHGRQHLLVIGDQAKLSLDQAKKLLSKIYEQLLNGIDPIKTRRDADNQKNKSFANLADTYLEQYAKVHKKTWKLDESRIRRHLLPAWRHLDCDLIQTSDVATLLAKLPGKYDANRTRELISKMFELSYAWGYRDEGLRNPAKGIRDHRETSRDRFLSQLEMQRLAVAIESEPSVFVRHAIWFALATGLRKSEILNLKWADIEDGVIRIGVTKNNRPHYIPVTTAVGRILAETPHVPDNEYVFAGQRRGRPLVNIRKPFERVRKEAQLEDVHFHDLRRTVGSWLVQSGQSLYLVGRVLNHRSNESTAVYARFARQDVLDALEVHGEKLRTYMPAAPATIGNSG